MDFTPEERRILDGSLKLHGRGIVDVGQLAEKINQLGHPDRLDAILAEIPPGLAERIQAQLSTLDSVNSLPPITSVEVVDLRGFSPDRIDQYMQEARDTAGVMLGEDASQGVASLRRQLPPGQRARCHTPPYGLRFRSGGEVILQASICWRCDNIFGQSSGADFSCAIRGDSVVARQLLAEIRRAFGHEPGDVREGP